MTAQSREAERLREKRRILTAAYAGPRVSEKKCPGCGDVKAAEDYTVERSSTDGLSRLCKPCRADLHHRICFAGANYTNLLQAQGGVCAICKTPDPGNASRRFCLDHDHRCCPGRTSCGKCVRGLLCINCNHGIGRLRDDADVLRAAAAYVEAHQP